MRVHDTPEPLPNGHGGWCPDCHLAWSETKAAHCAGCCAHFSSDSAFDLHHTLDPETRKTICHDPATLRTRSGKPKLVNRDGVWSAPGPDGGWPRRPDPSAEGAAGGIGPPPNPERAVSVGIQEHLL
jgi:hypothetical protein